MNVIETVELGKTYGMTPVLHQVSIHVREGTLVGFLGPNGAGKSTTIRILLGLLSASTGAALIFGKPSGKKGPEIRKEIGYLPGDVHLYTNMTGRAALNFFARARRRDCREEFDRLAETVDLDLSKTIRKYSTGMKQKLGLIQSLMHRPKLLILDEPTNGLDPLVRSALFAELKDVVAEGRTVLFSSHSLSEVEELCDEVIILRNGRVVEQQRIETLKQHALRRVEFEIKSPASDLELDLPENVTLIKKSGQTVSYTWSGETNDLLTWLGSFDLDDIVIERPDLNDLFMAYYTETTKSGAA